MPIAFATNTSLADHTQVHAFSCTQHTPHIGRRQVAWRQAALPRKQWEDWALIAKAAFEVGAEGGAPASLEAVEVVFRGALAGTEVDEDHEHSEDEEADGEDSEVLDYSPGDRGVLGGADKADALVVQVEDGEVVVQEAGAEDPNASAGGKVHAHDLEKAGTVHRSDVWFLRQSVQIIAKLYFEIRVAVVLFLPTEAFSQVQIGVHAAQVVPREVADHLCVVLVRH